MDKVFNQQNIWRGGDVNNFPQYKDRIILKELAKNLDNDLALGIIGSRQVGKTSLMFMLIKKLLNNNIPASDIYYFNLDSLAQRELLNNIDDFLFFIRDGKARKYIFIDEVQRLKEPGLFIKQIYDLKQDIKIIYSGSSQIEIKAKTKEHLVGRTRIFEIQRISWSEAGSFVGDKSFNNLLEGFLVYGSYPAVINESDINEKQLILRDIYQTYVEKDIAEFLRIDNIEAFNKLLILLAQQIGNLLNVANLAKTLRVSRSLVENYINILEQTYIIKKVYPFYQNYKKEISKTPKIYFLDLGLRNFILKNFLAIELREDKGALFENFYFLELIANDIYSLNSINYWRTTNQTEIDFIIRSDKGITAIETKYSDQKAAPRSFTTFKEYYPESECRLVSKDYFKGNKLVYF